MPLLRIFEVLFLSWLFRLEAKRLEVALILSHISSQTWPNHNLLTPFRYALLAGIFYLEVQEPTQ